MVKALEQVALDSSLLSRYPDQLSGGERQRLAIARSLAAEPTVLICDEVTSWLDVSVQAAIIELLAGLQRDMGLSMLFVTHNLALVRSISQEVAVMNDGRIVEYGARGCRPRRPAGRLHEEAALGHSDRLSARGCDGAPGSPARAPRPSLRSRRSITGTAGAQPVCGGARDTRLEDGMRARTAWLSASEKALIIDEALELLHRVGMRMSGSRSLDALAAAGRRSTPDPAWSASRPRWCARPSTRCPREFVMAGAIAGARRASSPRASRRTSARRGAPPSCSTTRPASAARPRSRTCAGPRRSSTRPPRSTSSGPRSPPTTFRSRSASSRATSPCSPSRDKHVTFVDCPSQVEPLLRIAGDRRRRALERVPRAAAVQHAAHRGVAAAGIDGPLLDFHAEPRRARRAGRGLHRAHGRARRRRSRGRDHRHTGGRRVPRRRDPHADADARARGCSSAPPGSTMDMRSAGVSYASPEAGLMDVGLRRGGARAGRAGDRARPGHRRQVRRHPGRATRRRSRASTACAAGADVLSGGVGIIDSANTLFLPQIVIDCGDRRDDPSPPRRRRPSRTRRSSVDMIERVGIGGDFLGEKETARRHARRRALLAGDLDARQRTTRGRPRAATRSRRARERMDALLAARAERRPAARPTPRAELAALCGYLRDGRALGDVGAVVDIRAVDHLVSTWVDTSERQDSWQSRDSRAPAA